MVILEVEGKRLVLDKQLKEVLDIFKRDLKKDNDFVLIVDGREGSGKSVFAMQIGYYLDPTLSADRICFESKDFIQKIKDAKNFQVVIHDEAIVGARAARWIDEINQALIETVAQCRQKNLVLILVIPSFYELEKYHAIHRSSALFHIYKDKFGNRGHFLAYNYFKKRKLYLLGKKTYSYSKHLVKWDFHGSFANNYVVNEEEYRRKKLEAFNRVKPQKGLKESTQLLKASLRLALLIELIHSQGFSYTDLENYFSNYHNATWKRTSIHSHWKKYSPSVKFMPSGVENADENRLNEATPQFLSMRNGEINTSKGENHRAEGEGGEEETK